MTLSKKLAIRLLRIASLLALTSLGLIMWALFDPRPIPVIASMSVGQGIGTCGFALYVLVVLWELKRKNVVVARPRDRQSSSSAQWPSIPPKDVRSSEGDDDR